MSLSPKVVLIFSHISLRTKGAAQQCDTLSTKIGFLSSYNIVSKRDEEIQSIMSEVEKNLIEISSYVPPIPAWLINKFRRAAQAAGMKHVMTSNEVLRREIREMAEKYENFHGG